jgi:hypothetical protein
VFRKKIVIYWLFFGESVDKMFKVNFSFLSLIYKQKCFSSFNLLILSLKRIVPLFFMNLLRKEIVFVVTQAIFSKVFSESHFYSFIKKIFVKKQDSLNGVIEKNKKKVAVVFLRWADNDFLLLESKRKNLPIIALVGSDNNSSMIDYPIFVNNKYFHTEYFFLVLFSKMLFLGRD